MVRKFNLYNARGEIVELLSDKLFALNPTGLGLSLENSYSQYQTYMIRTNSKVTQGSFQTNIVFSQIKSQTYQQFSDFAQFLAYQPYTLEYVIDSGAWKRDAYLKELPKSEAATAGLIDEQFTLEFINNWYNNKTAEYKSYDPDPNLAKYGKEYINQGANIAISDTNSIVGLAVVGKAILGQTEYESVTKAYFAYGYFGEHGDNDYYYAYPESVVNSSEKMLPLVNDSKYFGLQQGSPCIVTITGATINPHWTVIQGGVTVSNDGFTLTLADNQRLIVSSYPEDQYARVYNPDGSFVDVSQLQDFTMTNFVQIPEGESTVLVYVDKDTGVNLTFKEERLLV